jgi:capsid protein
MAFMVYGDKYRIDNYRGMPLLSTTFETAKKLERYKEAAVGGAEERQKIALVIEHEAHSTGENPFLTQTARAQNVGDGLEMPEDDNGTQLQNRVTATTNKQSINLPIGAKIATVDGKQELFFKDFYSVNIDLLCAAAQIPPNVAMSKYDSNFSASRAALKDWENTLRVRRYDFGVQFYQPIYEFWLEIEILLNKINAPGYIKARAEGNWMMLEAYRNTRYVGAPVPHIDPVKEVQAERLKMGLASDHVPLTTVEAATEAIGGGDYEANVAQFEEELKMAESFKPEIPEAVPPTGA